MVLERLYMFRPICFCIVKRSFRVL